MPSQQFWSVHMGRPGGRPQEGSIDLARQLMNRGYVSIGWNIMGDMSTLPDDREAFANRFWEFHTHYHSSVGASQAIGMLYRFVYGVQPGDIIVCPTPGGGDPVNFGEVVGDYQYEHDAIDGHVHLRQVKWLVAVPRENLSEAAKGNLRVNRSLAPIYKNEPEFRKYL